MLKELHRYARRTLQAVICLALLAGLAAAAFLMEDTGDYYIADNKIVEYSPVLDERSVTRATDRFRYLYDTYLAPANMDIFVAVIPDKSYYLPNPKGKMDYDALFSLVQAQTDYASWIDLTPSLSGEDYYATDSHWKQECLENTANTLVASMQGAGTGDAVVYEEKNAATDFWGSYKEAISSAGWRKKDAFSKIEADAVNYLTNETLEAASVYNYETEQTTGVYDWEKLTGQNLYDFYLSGPSYLLRINNPSASGQKLIVFRDSYGSSLIPLLVPYYSEIMVVDIRYVMSTKLGELIPFPEYENADALFLYSTTLLNRSATLR